MARGMATEVPKLNEIRPAKLRHGPEPACSAAQNHDLPVLADRPSTQSKAVVLGGRKLRWLSESQGLVRKPLDAEEAFDHPVKPRLSRTGA